MVKTDPFLELIKKKEADKKQEFEDALLFGKSEAHTTSGRDFVASVQKQFKEKGYLTQKQVDALYKVDSKPVYVQSSFDPVHGFESDFGEFDYFDYFDPFDP